MPIDSSKNQRLAVTLPHSTVRKLNAWRMARERETGRIPSLSEALRELVEKALEVWERERPQS